MQDTPNMEAFALSQGWVKNENEVKKQESKKAKKKQRNERSR